jgi:hypothetical protein
MKIKEEIFEEDGKIIHNRVYDNSDTLKRIDTLNDEELNTFGSDYKFVGSIPMNILANWIKEANLDWSDTQEINKLMRKKLMSGEFDRLMVESGKKYANDIGS